jgi:glycosyltransferase involved in cell wall biosynthesis
MKVLYVDLEREWRGGQSQALLTVKGLRALGHDAQLLSVRESPIARRAADVGIPVHDVGRKARRIGAALLLRKLLSRQSYDVLHANEPHALTAAWLAGAQERTGVVTSRRVAYPLSRSGLARKRYQIAQRIVAISHFVEQSLLESGVPREKVAVVYEGVPIPPIPSAEARQKARQHWGVTGNERLLGCVGYLLPEKGQGIAISALSTLRTRIPPTRLLLGGDGPCRPALEALAQQMGMRDQVIFAGFVEDVTQVYLALDAFVFPSLAEPLGTSLLAAMAWGLPAIAVASGGVPEYVKDGDNGLLAAQPDPELFSTGMLRILSDESLGSALGQKARRTIAERFSAERMVENTLRVYEDVLKKRRLA